MTDNGSPTDANAASGSADEFPSKIRVHALARMLGQTSRQVLAHLAELGIAARSPQSSVDNQVAKSVADRIRAHVEPDEAAVEAAEEAADTAGVEAATEAEAPTGPETPTEPEAAPAAETAPESPAPVEPVAEVPASEPVVAEAVVAETPAEPEAPAAVEATAEPEVPSEPATPAVSLSTPPAEPQKPVEAPTLFSAVEDTQHHPIVPSGEIAPVGPLFLQPQADAVREPAVRPSRSERTETAGAPSTDKGAADKTTPEKTKSDEDTTDTASDDDSSGDGDKGSRRRRRGRRGRGRGRGDQAEASGTDESDAEDDESGDDDTADSRPSGKKGKKSKKKDADDTEGERDDSDAEDSADEDDDTDAEDGDQASSKRRRRRRRRKGGGEPDEASPDDPPNTVVHEREPRSKRARDEVQGISGSTRLEAKRQRRRDGRDAGRRRPPILSESEFLARREAVDRVMVVRERNANSKIAIDGDGATSTDGLPVEDYTQVAVLEDGVLVEHFVTTETSSSMVGNIYLGRVQNVLPGMEAAFVDIGRGRNGVLYAGEVNWDAAGLDGGSRKIEQALKPGDSVLVQVSKDPVGHKGARLTTQISLAGRYLVYVPGGSSTGISRKLPDVERKRLKSILGKLVPEDAGVIIRTASEGVSAEDLGADIERLEAKWKDIDAAVSKAKSASGSSGPQALYEEPDLLVRVVRDLFNEDFRKLVVEGPKAWDLVERYINAVAPDLMERVEKFEKPRADAPDSFVVHRIDEQLAKALDRKVWLPSGGTLIIEHTEAMTVVDVNTGKFTGSGGNLEETVTRNNLEAAEEIVRQMRLRDIGGMIIVDFIDMVLESNRDLVLRRLTEALARDRTRHQVSEVTSLGLVQMTRKRLGTGLLEAFSTTCTHCAGRGIIVHANPVEVRAEDNTARDNGGAKRSRRGGGRRKPEATPEPQHKPLHNPAEHPMFRAMAAHAHDHDHDDEIVAEVEDTLTEVASAAPAEAAVEVEETTVDATETPATESAEPEPKPTATEPVVTEPVAVTPEPAAAPEAAPKRRRRVVRQAAAPTVHAEPVVMTADGAGGGGAQPLTTSGPTGGASSAEATVAVRRRPRRRTAGRPAGPPPADQ
ncbi:translation initiation factor IF-2 N-terminal domain-containing protein [Gordonia sp. CPCC 205515]|uniref:translation initiation factor IF-2 N-terminal domain-containing protein n=1 Tax=Gordonia sp. CPCC 205515 TaxID=3140791 RepID=UPI003AF383A6